MAFDNISDNFHKLKSSIKAYIEISAEYYKLELFNKGMKGATSLVNMLVLGFLFLFFLVFLSLAVSFLLGEIFGSFSTGFFIVTGFYLLCLLLMKFFGTKYIREKMLVSVSRKVFNKPEEDLNTETGENETV